MNKRYNKILEIIKNIPYNSTAIEIGVWGADLSCFLLDSKTEINKMYLIDPWKKYPSDYYIDSLNNCSQEQYEGIYNEVKEKINLKYGNRVEILRGEAEEFKNNFEENSIDFIYLDANNLYDEVFKNISSWFPKLKKNGILIGNNFIEDGNYIWSKDNYGTPICFGEYSVKSAVMVYSKQNNIPYFVPGGNQWFINKY